MLRRAALLCVAMAIGVPLGCSPQSSDPNEPGAGPKYFMLVDWSADKVATIRDFRHAPYVADGLEYLT